MRITDTDHEEKFSDLYFDDFHIDDLGPLRFFSGDEVVHNRILTMMESKQQLKIRRESNHVHLVLVCL
jgi:hypothetical protein